MDGAAHRATQAEELDGPLLFGRVLDGRGGGRPIGWAEAQQYVAAGAEAGAALIDATYRDTRHRIAQDTSA